ncbi:oleosin-B1 isoform X1 [Brassica rapa]|uniref:oleosin-B1 isoform X1 n=1 Tax=Brassica campestris TaxID=3711 RepID=UPI00142D3FD5|nr:oleosin-B1 isoform X1 [Brassica rapa]
MGLLKKKHPKHSKPTLRGFLTAVLATHAAVFLLVLAGLSLSGTAVAFIATMPLFVVFSPVLVPAGITTGLLAMGLAASGGSGLTALSIISWLYNQLYVGNLRLRSCPNIRSNARHRITRRP